MNSYDLFSWLKEKQRRPLVMGVLNLTPDSFSDGGQISDPEGAAERAEQMVKEGADWIDVGGESTRPGSEPVAEQEQIRRTAPAIAAIRRRLGVVISIDTTWAAVAMEAIQCGANVVNDTSAGRDDAGMLPLIARTGAAVILMHRLGTPATMQVNPSYRDVTAEVKDFLTERMAAAQQAGIEPGRILLDPGIGFGKNEVHNLQLLRDTAKLAALGPLVVGPSRKSFIGKITGQSNPADRVFGTAAAVGWCVASGAAVARVHDVAAMSQVVRMAWAISTAKMPDFLTE